MPLVSFFFNFLNECEITSVAFMQKIRVVHQIKQDLFPVSAILANSFISGHAL